MAKAPGSAAQASASETEITLGLLSRVQDDSALTQRSVARDLGIALGLANAYLKRCVRKGFIKVRQIPPNRYAYYLTPQGFAEKSRLTAEYLSISLDFFRVARSQCAALLEECRRRDWRRVALAGSGDLAEIAALCAARDSIALAGVVDAGAAGSDFMDMPVVARLDALGAVDAVIVTDLKASQATFDAMALELGRERVLAPPILNVAFRRPNLVE